MTCRQAVIDTSWFHDIVVTSRQASSGERRGLSSSSESNPQKAWSQNGGSAAVPCFQGAQEHIAGRSRPTSVSKGPEAVSESFQQPHHSKSFLTGARAPRSWSRWSPLSGLAPARETGLVNRPPPVSAHLHSGMLCSVAQASNIVRA